MARSCTFELVYPPWAFARDDGAELERIHGEVGLDGIVVCAVSGPVATLRPSASENALFVTDGGWHFPAHADHYRGSGLRARAATWIGRRDTLAPLAEFAARHALRMSLRIEATNIPALLHAEPSLCTHSAWDGGALARRACPCNPNWRALVGDVCGDLERYSPAAFELGASAPDIPLAESDSPTSLHDLEEIRALAAICFCPACREIGERAGVDVDAVRRSVRVHAERIAHLPADPGAPAAAAEDEALQRFRAARAEDHRAWLVRLSERLQPRRLRILAQYAHGPRESTRANEFDSIAALAISDRVALRDTPAEAAQQIAVGHAGACVPVARPCFLAADELVRAVHHFSEAVQVLEFADVESAPPEAIGWLRQALRYARRS